MHRKPEKTHPEIFTDWGDLGLLAEIPLNTTAFYVKLNSEVAQLPIRVSTTSDWIIPGMSPLCTVLVPRKSMMLCGEALSGGRLDSSDFK